MGAAPSSIVRTGFGIAGSLSPIPVGPVGELLAVIIELCESVPKNKHVSSRSSSANALLLHQQACC